MRTLLLISLIFTVVFGFPSVNVESKAIVNEQVQSHKTYVLEPYAKDWPEAKIRLLFLNTPHRDLEKYNATVVRHKTFTDFNTVLADLKKVDSPFFAKWEPLYKQLQAMYLTMPDNAKILVKEYYLHIWTQIALGLADGQVNKDFAKATPALKDKFAALTPSEKESLKANFPLTYEIM